MNPRARCRRAVLLTTAAGAVVAASAFGVAPAFADTSGTAATSAATPAATPATSWSSTAGAMPVDSGTQVDTSSSYAASSPTSPILLGSVTAGEAFSFDLRPTNPTGATYTLTNADGTPLQLGPTTTFQDGVLSGSATTTGTFVAQVTATTSGRSISEWLSGTVVAADPVSVDVSATNRWTGVTTTTSTAGVAQGGSLVLTALVHDRFGNVEDAAARATVTSDQSSDVVVDGPTGWVVSFPQPGTHLVTVTVGGVSTSLTVTVSPRAPRTTSTGTGSTPAVPALTAPSGLEAVPAPATAVTPVSTTSTAASDVPTPASVGTTADTVESVPSTASLAVPASAVSTLPTPAPLLAHVTTAASIDQVSGSTLASTGSRTSGPMAWVLGLLAASAAVTGLRFRRRRRY